MGLIPSSNRKQVLNNPTLTPIAIMIDYWSFPLRVCGSQKALNFTKNYFPSLFPSMLAGCLCTLAARVLRTIANIKPWLAELRNKNFDTKLPMPYTIEYYTNYTQTILDLIFYYKRNEKRKGTKSFCSLASYARSVRLSGKKAWQYHPMYSTIPMLYYSTHTHSQTHTHTQIYFFLQKRITRIMIFVIV